MCGLSGQETAGALAGRHTIGKGQNAIDPHGVDSGTQLNWVVVAGDVLDSFWVEQHEVGSVALPQAASISEPETFGRKTSHPAYGFSERKQLLFAEVVGKHAGEGSPEPRVRQRIVR